MMKLLSLGRPATTRFILVAERTIYAEWSELEQRLSSDIPTSRKNRDRNRMARAKSKAADIVDELCLVLDALLLEVIDHYDVRTISDPSRLVATNILQSGQTTGYAVALLLQHGYVVDADARWRGLYELTCQAAVMAKASDVRQATLRYLMHGQKDLAENRLKPRDLEKGRAIVQQELLRMPRPTSSGNAQGSPYWERDYQWITVDVLGGKPKNRITQRDIFEIADLKIAPRSFVDDSHMSVHMSSLVVASEGAIALDHNPGGYDADLEEQIALRTALTLYELVANCCLLAPPLRDGRSYLAWVECFHKRVRAVAETFI